MLVVLLLLLNWRAFVCNAFNIIQVLDKVLGHGAYVPHFIFHLRNAPANYLLHTFVLVHRTDSNTGVRASPLQYAICPYIPFNRCLCLNINTAMQLLCARHLFNCTMAPPLTVEQQMHTNKQIKTTTIEMHIIDVLPRLDSLFIQCMKCHDQ